MKTVRAAILFALIGLVLCLWLLVRVDWYNFVAFMMVAQPLLVLGLLIFIGVVVRELKRRESSMTRTQG